MSDMIDFTYEADRTLRRLRPRLELLLPDAAERAEFFTRLERHFPAIFGCLTELYGARYDFFYYLEDVLRTAARMYADREPGLKDLDRAREGDPRWYQSQRMVGGVCYVDLFADDLEGIRDRIPYFKELGLTYLHLMPLFRAPEGENDGGFAISSYRDVRDDLGTIDDLRTLARELRQEGISLVLDFVFNHTSDEHTWAQRALAGERDYQDYYWMFPDRHLPDQYEQHLREIFPEQAPGSFTFRDEINKWVWTTFHDFQWDLNYHNPAVFAAMLGELLFIANSGAEVLRLDAVVFIWKQLGTTCEGLPPVHTIIRAFNALVRVVAPAMIFKSEAIVHPDVVNSYVNTAEAPISYNPTMMALIWESLATRRVELLRTSMQRRFDLPDGAAWVNYVRVHDDIGWTFADEDAATLGINGFDHRQFLNMFYTGQFPGSFATGLPFNYNEITRDMRISGMCASLAGLEQAIDEGDPTLREHALRRIEMIHAVIISVGGIPLIYLGDEIALLNDYSFQADPLRNDDTRWVHRVRFDWDRALQRHDPTTDAGRIFQMLRRLIRIRKQLPSFHNVRTIFLNVPSEHVLGYLRNGEVLILANFSEHAQTLHLEWLPDEPVDLVSGAQVDPQAPLTLDAYRFVWLAPQRLLRTLALDDD